jgi:hypothetical protein
VKAGIRQTVEVAEPEYHPARIAIDHREELKQADKLHDQINKLVKHHAAVAFAGAGTV